MPNPTPRTIEELQAWYVAHQLPPEEVTRFFIGKNITEPRAFGIYQEGDRFVVYKNKDNGTRAVRYQGPDEAYAVNELYMKLKEEISLQKGRNAAQHQVLDAKARRSAVIIMILTALGFIAITAWIIFDVIHAPNRGYYHYDDTWYYYQNDGWYYYDDYYGWNGCNTYPQTLADNYNDYYTGKEYVQDAPYSNFELTDYYATTDTDSTWSSSDSWDSGSTDWSSDW